MPLALRRCASASATTRGWRGSPSRTAAAVCPKKSWLRLENGQSLRDPPLRRSSGGIGGLGLAIAQRVAALHGGSLRPLPSPGGGTRLCLALPLAQAQAQAI
jgi:signal transduction histidine kinase